MRNAQTVKREELFFKKRDDLPLVAKLESAWRVKGFHRTK